MLTLHKIERMNNTGVFINGLGNVSPQNTLDNECFLSDIANEHGPQLRAIEPDYKDLIPARYLRRMSRTIKMGVYAAKLCLQNAALKTPLDAIITGTGLGCVQDTEQFLQKIFEHDEAVVSPTTFIQSTHNTVSAQIALMLQCNGYNFTYTHRGFSFESAVMDALMKIDLDGAENILVGGIDEITDSYLKITQRMKQWKTNGVAQLGLLEDDGRGSVAGEGAAFFVLSKETSPSTYARILDVEMIYKPKGMDKVVLTIEQFLHRQGLSIAAMDLVLLGLNGNPPVDRIYHQLKEGLLSKCNLGYFKHLCGEYKTASAFGCWLAAQILAKQALPEVVKWNSFEVGAIQNVLIYNNYSNINHSLFLLQTP